VNAVNKDGATALHDSASAGKLDVVEALIRCHELGIIQWWRYPASFHLLTSLFLLLFYSYGADPHIKVHLLLPTLAVMRNSGVD
jgi:hypothetical protein